MAETHLLRARRRGGEHRAEAWVLAGVVVAATVSTVQVARWLAERFEVQTQWPTLVVAGGLACWAPRAFGVTLGSSVWRRPEALAAVLLVGDVVALFRMIGGSVPWAGRPVWIAVPVVEGLLPGGFCVAALLWVFRRGLRCRHFSVAGHPRGLPRVNRPGRLPVPHRRGRSPHVVASSTTCLGPVCSILGSPSSTRTPRAWGAWQGDATTRSSAEVPVRRPADQARRPRLVPSTAAGRRAAAAGRRTVPGAPAPHTGRDDQP